MRALAILTVALCVAGAGSASRADEPPAPDPVQARKGYLLFRSEFPDKEAIRPYGRAVVPLAARFGGRFIALADAPEAVEGSPDTRRIVILEFPSLEAARAFWTSPDYAEVKKLREGVGTVEALLFEGS